jgi:ubiquinone/menaquinone biosynthesis C-methylase UbiE
MSRPWHIRRWDLFAAHYDRFFQFRAQRARSLAMAGVQPGESVLICGCGTGTDFEFLPRDARILAVDASPAMLEIAAAKARRLGHEARLEVMDATRLNLESARFDVVILHLIVAVVPDHAAVLREAARVLRPGGRIALLDKYFAGPGSPRLIRRLLDPLMAHIATSINVPMHELAARSGLRFVREEPVLLRGMFRAARLEFSQPSSNSSA